MAGTHSGFHGVTRARVYTGTLGKNDTETYLVVQFDDDAGQRHEVTLFGIEHMEFGRNARRLRVPRGTCIWPTLTK